MNERAVTTRATTPPISRIVWAWALVLLAIYVAISFTTYVPPGLGNGEPLTNVGGRLGQRLGQALVEGFGVGAFGLPFFLVFLGWRLRTRPRVTEPLLKVLGVFMLMLAFGLVMTLAAPGRVFPRGYVPIGGILGDWLGTKLVLHFGRWWSVAIAGLGAGAALILSTDSFFLEGLARWLSRHPTPKTAEAKVAARKRAARELERTVSPLATDEEPVEDETPIEARDAAMAEGAADGASSTEDGAAPPIEAARPPRASRSKKAPERRLLETLAKTESAESDTFDVPKPKIKDGVAPAVAAAAAAPTLSEARPKAEQRAEDDAPAGDDDAPAPRVRRPRASSRKKPADAPVPDLGLDLDDGDDHEVDALDGFDDVEAEGDDEDDAEAPAAAPAARAKPPVPPSQVRIRDGVPAGKPGDATGVTVINLSRDPKLKGKEKYELPPLTLLNAAVYSGERESDEALQEKARQLVQALQDFGVQATVEEIERGPVITRFDLNLARGTKISRVTGLAEDLGMTLGVGRVRIAQVKGKAALGVEIPNRSRETVFLKELALAAATAAPNKKIAIPLFLGKDSAGNPIIEDLASTPHLLIAGRTGAGKSVFVNSLVLSILLTRYPEEVRLIMIDPKRVELEVYQDIPHLLTRVESDPKKSSLILQWAIQQMEERYELLSAVGVRHITSFNKLGKEARKEMLSKLYSEGEIEKVPETMPYIVIIVDELADLMMTSGKETEQAIARLAQKARAVGIHVVLATQRPSTDVITGLIKSNLPSRIAFQTRTGIDSRTILDRQGAEKLLDKGDMLFLAASAGDDLRRIQGPFVSDEEVTRVVDYLKTSALPQYTHSLIQVGAGEMKESDAGEQDELFEQAVEIVLQSKQASTSWLQRQLSVGYARAGRLVDLMTQAGYISGPNGSKPREILITIDQWNELKGKTAAASASEGSEGAR